MSYLHRLSLSTDAEHVTTKLACDYTKHHCPTLPQEFSSIGSIGSIGSIWQNLFRKSQKYPMHIWRLGHWQIEDQWFEIWRVLAWHSEQRRKGYTPKAVCENPETCAQFDSAQFEQYQTEPVSKPHQYARINWSNRYQPQSMHHASCAFSSSGISPKKWNLQDYTCQSAQTCTNCSLQNASTLNAVRSQHIEAKTYGQSTWEMNANHLHERSLILLFFCGEIYGGFTMLFPIQHFQQSSCQNCPFVQFLLRSVTAKQPKALIWPQFWGDDKLQIVTNHKSNSLCKPPRIETLMRNEHVKKLHTPSISINLHQSPSISINLHHMPQALSKTLSHWVLLNWFETLSGEAAGPTTWVFSHIRA